MKVFASILLVCMLAGCSAVAGDPAQPSDLSTFLDRIRNVTLADIDAALADVHAHGDIDMAALSCLPAIGEFLTTAPLGGGTAPDVKGVLSANQIKRDILLGGVTRNGPFQIALRKLHVACAAYVGDEARFAAEFSAMIGAASHGVPPITGIPALPAGIAR